MSGLDKNIDGACNRLDRRLIGNRIEWIDSLKGIAMCGVVLIHAGGANLPGYLGRIGKAGHFGVQGLFMISGFLIWSSLEKSDESYLCWIKRKLLRLMPQYYVAYVTALLISIYWGNTYSVPDVLVHVFGIWGFFPQYNNVIIAEWYLGALIIFYMIAPLIYRLVNSIARAILFFQCSIVFAYLFNRILVHVLGSRLDNYAVSSYIGNTSLWYQLPSISFGVLLFYIINYLKITGLTKKESTILSWTLVGFAIIFSMGEIAEVNRVFGFNPYIRVTFVFALCAVSQCIHATSIVTNKLFNLIGANSYSIYLFHLTIIQIISKFINSETVLGVLVCTIIGIGVPLLVFFLVGKLKEVIINER